MAVHTMRAGYSHSQGGVYQHSIVNALASPQDSMVESLSHASAQRLQDNTQTLHISNGLQRQQMRLERRESPGLQHLHGLPHPTAQPGSFETSAGHQMVYSKPDFISNKNTDLQQRQHSAGSPALRGSGNLLGQTNANVEAKPPTDDQIQAFITGSLEFIRSSKPQSDHNTPKSNIPDHRHRSRTSASSKEERHAILCAEQRTAAVGRAPQKDSPRRGSNANAEFTVKSRDTDSPQITAKVAATCTQNEDERPLVVPVSKKSWNARTQDPGLMSDCSSSNGEETSCWWNNNNISGEMDRKRRVAHNETTEREKGAPRQKSVEAVELDNAKCVTVSEDLQTKSSSVVTANKTSILTSLPCENEDSNKNKKKDTEHQHQEAIIHSRQDSLVYEIHTVISVPTDQSELLRTSHEDVMERTVSQSSQSDSSQTLSKFQNTSLSPESSVEKASICKNPQYEDISDEDTQHKLTNLPHAEPLTLCCKDPQYEDLSEEDSQQVNEDNRFEQDQATHTDMCTCSGETDDLCPKCDHERHLELDTNYSASCSPSLALMDEVGTDDEMDDDDDDDYIFIPITLTDIKFEPEDKLDDEQEVVVISDNELGGEDQHSDTNSAHLLYPVPNPEPSSACSPLEVFDTIQSFFRAKANMPTRQSPIGLVSESDLDMSNHERQSNGEQHAPQTRREPSSEPEDSSCETEDSNDYSSGSEHHLLTVPKHMLKKRARPLPSETDDSDSDQECEFVEATNVQNGEARTKGKSACMTKLAQLMARSKRVSPKTQIKNSPKMEDVIIIDSDTDDEIEEASFRKNRSPAPSSPAPQHQPERLKAPSGHINHETCRKTSLNKKIRHSYAEDVRPTTSKGKVDNRTSKKKKKTVSPVPKDDSNASTSVQKRPPSEATKRLDGPVKKKLKKNVPSSSDAPKKQPQSVDKVAGCLSDPNPGVSRMVVEKSSISSNYVRISKETDVQRKTPKTLSATRRKSDSCENNRQHSLRDETEKIVSNEGHCAANKVPTSATKLRLLSRQLSEPSPSTSSRKSSTSIRSATSTSGKRPEARRSSESGEKTASSSSKTMQSTSVPQRNPSRQRSTSLSISQPLDHPSSTEHPSSNAPVQSSREKMKNIWRDNYHPTRRDKQSSKGTEKTSRTASSEPRREGRSNPHYREEHRLREHRPKERRPRERRPREHRQRNNSQESATPLMRRSMMEAMEITKARSRDIMRGTSSYD